MAPEQATNEAGPGRAQARLSREMEDEVYSVLGALLGMLEVLSIDAVEPLTPRQRRFLDEALRFGDRLKARVEALVTLLSDENDERFKPSAYPLRRLIDHAVRGACWAAKEKGVSLSLPASGGWENDSLSIDAARVDRALRGVTDTLVAAVGEHGRVEVRVLPAGAQCCIELRGFPDAQPEGVVLELSALLLSAWHHTFALQKGSLRLDRETFTARVELPRKESA